ncbi:MAG: ribosome small subunit-dependent GTPase A [Thermoflexales bacterium]|nr:ribosome small subunit-dependent GTPase A [Thermoflexales bacterium]MDW8350771.1 ribosome small subunit-dependent GTPase A [Anaerolineae bacterium]
MTKSGLVIKAQSGFFTVHCDDGSRFVCKAAGRLTKGKHEEDALAVGDRVTVEALKSEGLVNGRIIAVAPRGRTLSRLDPAFNARGKPGQEIRQVLVANVDLVAFVFACAEPEFHPRMLDRYLVGAEAQRLSAVIVASKADLVGLDEARAMFAIYEQLGYEVIYTSTHTDHPAYAGVAQLRERLHGRLSVLTGKSGVGKSSLLNALKPGLDKEVGRISEALKKGRHTTVVPELVQLDECSWIADTPGIRAYAVWDVQAEELDGYYREIAPLVSQCEFSDCTHTHEPGCAVIRALKRGEISQARYDSYLRLREELSQQRKW